MGDTRVTVDATRELKKLQLLNVFTLFRLVHDKVCPVVKLDPKCSRIDPFCFHTLIIDCSIVLKVTYDVKIEAESRVILDHLHELDGMISIICHLFSLDTIHF